MRDVCDIEVAEARPVQTPVQTSSGASELARWHCEQRYVARMAHRTLSDCSRAQWATAEPVAPSD